MIFIIKKFICCQNMKKLTLAIAALSMFFAAAAKAEVKSAAPVAAAPAAKAAPAVAPPAVVAHRHPRHWRLLAVWTTACPNRPAR